MSVLTKIATKATPDFFIFAGGQEEEYFSEICQFCFDEDCNDNCVVPFPVNGVECEHCNGQGRIKFLMKPADNGESYFVITLCGMCDGIGLV